MPTPKREVNSRLKALRRFMLTDARYFRQVAKDTRHERETMLTSLGMAHAYRMSAKRVGAVLKGMQS